MAKERLLTWVTAVVLALAYMATCGRANAKEKDKAPKACAPKVLVSPQITLESPASDTGWAHVYVVMSNVDERCFCPSVEFTIVPEHSFGSQYVWIEAQESDCEPWRAEPGPPSIKGGKYIEGEPATPRRWSWTPGGQLARYGHRGYFKLPRGRWDYTFRLKQGKWETISKGTGQVIGGEVGGMER
jgi:hypothetical protein